jgi:hypothetical protein
MCGAPIDVRAVVSKSGWQKQPPIKDMARIQFGQSHVQIEGTQVPTADFTLVGDEWVYFGHHNLLWMDPSTRLQAMSMRGAWKRVMAGMPVIMAQAAGPGHLALADNHAGEIVALPLQANQQIWVREHRFLAATGNIAYNWESSPIWYNTIRSARSVTVSPPRARPACCCCTRRATPSCATWHRVRRCSSSPARCSTATSR